MGGAQNSYWLYASQRLENQNDFTLSFPNKNSYLKIKLCGIKHFNIYHFDQYA